ncbi:NB-ARC domain-containing protein [Dysgonomonas sp.]|uniref:NB-ARC domain-containing protein n=1 Tax=Dysgonomonas sp. TaxID=1891233 RepID=UPI0027BAC2CE|nr:NB-ARC domain-containing protein [Dysgonomonas sp.]
MYIENQNANTIYNIGGDYINESPEVVLMLKAEKQKKLKELHSVSYFESLKNEYSEKKIICRKQEIQNIKDELKGKSQLLIYGDPGLGKTTLLYQLLNELDNIIYLSVKDKSPLSIVSYLINKIRQIKGDELMEFHELDDALNWLQAVIQYTNCYFVIDDSEQNENIVNILISLDKYDATFIFASRNLSMFDKSSIKSYACTPFSEVEMKEYLEISAIKLNLIEFNEIYIASKGNPLYLFYFSKFQIHPFPDDLNIYQKAIWRKLSTTEQEILTFVSIPYFNISLEEISGLIDIKNPLDLLDKTEKISSLLKNTNGNLEIFHPSFKEFILDYIRSKGLYKLYSERLGIYYLEKENIIQATYLLIDSNPEKIEDYLLPVYRNYIEWGELKFGLKILKTKLNYTSDSFERGYIYYHLSEVNSLLGNNDEFTRCIDKSLSYLNESDVPFYSAALMYKAINLVQNGKIEEANKTVTVAFDKLGNDQTLNRAFLLVNLSKICVDISEYEKGANACKEAFDIFKKEKHTEGIFNSLINLVSCLGQMDGYKDEAEKYAFILLEKVVDTDNFAYEIVILNALASLKREKKEYEKAKEYSNRAIKLCQHYGMKAKAVMNLINYGNILRDEDKIDDAITIYNDALIYTKEYKLHKDESRIYWILSGIYRNRNELDISIEYADKSIECSKEINNYYGVANAYEEKACSLILKDKNIEAAESYAESAFYFNKIEEFSEAYQRNITKAILLFSKEGYKNKVNELLNQLIQNTSNKVDAGKIIDAMLDCSDENTASNFEKLFNSYFTKQNNINIINSFIDFINYCKTLPINDGHSLFIKIIKLIIENLGVSRFSYSILGIGIEQSGILLNYEDMKEISLLLSESLPFISTREINDELIFITSIEGKINLELHCFNDETICNKLIVLLILILHENSQLAIENKPFIENFCKINIWLYKDDVKKIIDKYAGDRTHIFNDLTQTLKTEKNDYQCPEIMIVNPDYEIRSNMVEYPENKVSLYYLTTMIMGIKGHFYHTDIVKSKEQRTLIMNAIAHLIGYSGFSYDETFEKSKYKIEIEQLDFNSLLK